MKILLVHNYYQQEGGEDRSFEAEATVLEEQGHQVIRYTANNDTIPNRNGLALAMQTIWNHSAYREVRAIIQGERPDLVHCQNTFPLISPSIYYAAKAERLPVIQNLSNYRLFCANGIFYRKGRVCEACLGKKIAWPGMLHACYRQSYRATAVASLMVAIHRSLKTWHNKIDLYITYTEFARRKFIEGGLPAESIVVKPRFVTHDPQVEHEQQHYALFVGRLSNEKGIHTLLQAWRELGDCIPLKILGDGNLATEVQQAVASNPQVEWLGNRNQQEVYEYIGKAAFLVFPSECYETFGRVAIESFAKGTPVVATNIGAVGEITRHGITGLLFRPGNVEDLKEKVKWLLAHPAELAAMRKRARREYERLYTMRRNYELTMQIYEKAIAKNAGH